MTSSLHPGLQRQASLEAMRDAAAVIMSSAGLLEKYIDRLPKPTRDRQLAALTAAAAEIQDGIESLLEDEG